LSGPRKLREYPAPECGYYLDQIYFYLTEGCNLRCRHCWIVPKYDAGNQRWPAIPFDLFRDIVEQGKPLGLRGVKLTGGEPLIHPDIDVILDYIAAAKLRLTIETNGLELTPERAAKIRQAKAPFVSISLDGADAETHEWVRGVEGCFEAALRGLRNCVDAGLRPQVIMSVMRRNAGQLEALAHLAAENGAASVKFNIVMPAARGRDLHKTGETLSIQELVELGLWIESFLVKTSPLKVIHSHPFAFKPLSAIYGNGDRGRCGIFGIIGVLGNGKYALCGIGETVPELLFGDAREKKLAGVWNNNPVLNALRQGLPRDLKGICGDCLMKNQCLGSCIANNYYLNQDLLAPFWYCQEALEAGLFPASRIRPGGDSESSGSSRHLEQRMA